MSTLNDLNKADAEKPKKQPREYQELVKRFKYDFKQAESGKMRKRRMTRIERIDQLVNDGHTYDMSNEEDRIQINKAFYPRMHIAQMLIEMALPKILDEHYMPFVAVEENKRTFFSPDDPNAQRFQQFQANSGIDPAKPALETAADFLNAYNEYHYEEEGIEGKTTRFARGIAQYGSYWVKDAYDGSPKADLYNPRDIYQDPAAPCAEKWQYVVCTYTDTIGNIREQYEEWGHLIRPMSERKIRTQSKNSPYREDPESYSNEHVEASRVALYEYWVRDDSEEAEIKEVRIQDVETYQAWLEAGYEPEPVYERDLVTGQNTQAGWKAEYETGEMVKTYPSGWRQVIICQDYVLSDGKDNKLPEGCSLPLHQAGWFPIDGSTHYKGLIDSVMDNLQIFNVLFKFALEDVNAGGVDFWDLSQLKDATLQESDLLTATRRKAYTYASKAVEGSTNSSGSPLTSIPPAETAQSVLALLEAARMFIEWTTGLYDPRMSIGGQRDDSGALIKELKDGSYERIGPVKESIKLAYQDMFTNWCHYAVTYDDQERQYKSSDFFGESRFTFAPDVIGKFEWNFDVRIGNGIGLPRDPADQAEYLEALFRRLLMDPKPVRDVTIRLRRFPFQEKLIEALDAAEAILQQQQADAAAAQANSGETIQEQVQKDAGKNLTQLLQQVGSDGEATPGDVQASLDALFQLYTTGNVDPVTLQSITGIKTDQTPPGLMQ